MKRKSSIFRKLVVVVMVVVLSFSGCFVQPQSGNVVKAAETPFGTFSAGGITWYYSAYNNASYGDVRYCSLGIVSVENKNIKEIEIPSDVMIGDIRYPVTGLIRYTYFDSETNSNKYAPGFADLPNLTSVSIPSTISYVANEVFKNCSSLNNIEIREVLWLREIKEIDKEKEDIEYYTYDGEEYVIQTSGYNFSDVQKIVDTGKEGPCKITTIGARAFEGCSSFSDTEFIKNLLASVSSSGFKEGVFKDCTGLTSVKIGSESGTEVTIPESMFEGCLALSEVIIDENITKLNIGKSAFKCTSNLKNITFNCDVDVKNSAFMGSGLKEVTFNQGTVTLKAAAFAKCASLESVVFSDNLENLTIYPYGCFAGDIRLQSLDFRGNSVTLCSGALENITNLSKLTFNNTGTTQFDGSVFAGEYIPVLGSCLEEEQPLTYESFEQEILMYLKEVEINSKYFDNTNSRSSVSENAKLETIAKNYMIGIYDTSEKDYSKLKENLKFYDGAEDPFYHTYQLDKIIFGENCEEVDCTLTYTWGNSIIFKNPYVSLNEFYDKRSGTAYITTYYGFETVRAYVNSVSNDSSFNQNVAYKSVASEGTPLNATLKAGVSSQISKGEKLDTNNIIVTLQYYDGSFVNLQPQDEENNKLGYTISDLTDFSTEETGPINAVIAISYANCNTYLQGITYVDVDKEVKKFDVEYIGSGLIDGGTVTESDFKISNVEYVDGSKDETCNQKFEVKLKDRTELVSGEKNIVEITYKGVTIDYTLQEEFLKIKELKVAFSDEEKEYYEEDVLSKEDFIVTAIYENGREVKNYTKYEIINPKLKEGDAIVTIKAGEASGNIEIKVKALIAEALRVTYNDLCVVAGGKVDASKLVVELVYNNKKTKVLSENEYSFASYTIVSGQQNELYVYYNENKEVKSNKIYVTGLSSSTDNLTITNNPTVTVTPKAGSGQEAQPSVTIKPVSVDLNKYTVNLGIKEKFTLVVTGDEAITYESADTKIATIDSDGVITAKKKGKVKITVKTASGIEKTCDVNVYKAPTAINVSFKKKTLAVGKTAKIKISYPKGCVCNTISAKVKNKKIVTMDATGKITARKKGKTYVIFKTYNGKKAKILIVVK